MKKVYPLLILMLFICSTAFGVPVQEKKDRLSSKEITVKFEQLESNIESFFSEEAFIKSKHRKPKFHERLVMRWMKKRMKKKLRKAKKKLARHQSPECDLIVLNSGVEIEALVEEITDSSIIYKRCEDPDGKNYTQAKSEVSMVKYSNGDVTLIDSSGLPFALTGDAMPEKKENITLAIISGILAPFALSAVFPVLFLFAPLLCLIYPKGRRRKAFLIASAGVIILSIILALIIIFAFLF